MTNLPVEVWNQIFPLLHQRDKVECMTVCREWAAIIESTCLFHTVRIGSELQLVYVVAKAQQEPENAAKVERLLLDFDRQNFRSNILSYLFPNVREYYDLIGVHEGWEPFSNAMTPHPWSKQIECFYEYFQAINTCAFLKLGLCPKLTTISLESNRPIDGADFAALLRNTPALKTLRITFCNFTENDLEIMHHNAPCLESLTLGTGLIFCDPPPQNIKPASALTTFHIRGMRVPHIESAQHLCQYIALKYPNLKDLDHTIYSDLVSEEAYYDNGWLPLFKKLGLQLDTFKLEIEGDIQFPFTIFDDAGCQIKRLELFSRELSMDTFRALADSGQTEHIQSLLLEYIEPFESYEQLARFSMLRRLEIRYVEELEEDETGHVLNLNDFFGTIGDGLEDLRLDYVHLDFDPINIRKYHALKHLSIAGTTLPSHLDTFISQSFPNLNTLKFKRVDLSDHGFIIPNIDLSCFEMIKEFEEEDTILVTTCNNNEQRWYTAKSTLDTLHTSAGISIDIDPNLYPPVVSLPFDHFTGHPFMTLVCKSLRNCYVVHRRFK